MNLNEKEIIIPRNKEANQTFEYFSNKISDQLKQDKIPVRFVITRTDRDNYYCELGVLSDFGKYKIPPENHIFNFKKRDFENVNQFNAVLLIPTGIGADIGGHSGDGGALARLIASACDNLITHPNVVNAADINELTENTLYVEGSVITRLMMGAIGLQKVRSNRIMLVIDDNPDAFFHEAAINSASAARAAMGLDLPLVVKMDDKVLMRSLYSSSGRAIGRIEYLEYLYDILKEYGSQYDAVALSSDIKVPENFHLDYFRDENSDMVNPWGGVEAMLTHAISLMFDVPSAHSPMASSREILNLNVGVVDPRKSAEAISTTYLHCILKGLHKSPQIINSANLSDRPGLLTVSDISCLIIPDGCIGLPTFAALDQGIPVIAVRENKNRMKNDLKELPFEYGKLFIVDNYLEAIGIMNALKSGVAPEAVRRPLSSTQVKEYKKQKHSQHLKSKTDDHIKLESDLILNKRRDVIKAYQ